MGAKARSMSLSYSLQHNFAWLSHLPSAVLSSRSPDSLGPLATHSCQLLSDGWLGISNRAEQVMIAVMIEHVRISQR